MKAVSVPCVLQHVNILPYENFDNTTIIYPRNLDIENEDTPLRLDDCNIERTNKIKLLGVNIENKFNFTDQLCTTTSQKVGVLMRLQFTQFDSPPETERWILFSRNKIKGIKGSQKEKK